MHLPHGPREGQAQPAGTVTRLVAAKGRKSLVEVYIDGEPALTLSLDVAAGLHRGDTLSSADVADLIRRDLGLQAVGAALQLVARRPRSRRELTDRLRRKGLPEEAVDHAYRRLDELGYLDDEGFADWWVQNRLQHQPRGRVALRHELVAKGVDRATADRAVADIDETLYAERVARSVARRYERLEGEAFDARVAQHLQRRGFDVDATRHGLRAARAEVAS